MNTNCTLIKNTTFTAILLSALAILSATVNAAEINYKALYQGAAPAVVMVYGETGKRGGTGTGSIITKSGLVLTNAHVALSDMKNSTNWDRLFIFLKPEKVTGKPRNDLRFRYKGSLVAVNPDFDLALIQIVNPPDNLPVLSLSDLANIEIGESTVAIGHPSGGAKWTLTTGRLSASWEDFNNIKGRDVFQTETSINPGNSGGPLLDGAMNIIGINTFIIRESKSGMALTGLNYAVKSSTAREWIVSVLGQLPKETIATRPSNTPPSPKPDTDKIATATPKTESPKKQEPVPQPSETTPSTPEKTALQRQPAQQQKQPPEIQLVQPKPKKQAYYSKAKPGGEYSEDEIDSLQKRMARAFDELDREVDNMGWGTW